MVMVMLVVILTCFVIIHKQGIHRHVLQLKETQHHYARELLQTRIEVQDQALNWASREFHDNVGQVLGMIRMTLLDGLEEAPRHKLIAQVKDCASRLHHCLIDMADLSHSLNSDRVAHIGLVEALEQEAAHVRSLHRMHCSLTCSPQLPELSTAQELMIFRIVQEGLNNIMRHAQATHAAVSVKSQEDGTLILRITDNGKGMDAEAMNHPQGIGITNMRTRAHMMHGSLTIHSEMGKGTTLKIILNPLNHGNSPHPHRFGR
jgi:signal transduction histidine kinase